MFQIGNEAITAQPPCRHVFNVVLASSAVYTPVETEFLIAARAAGLSILSGSHLSLVPAIVDMLRAEGITHVVHLASVLQASPDRARDYDIDVNGTRNVLEACVAAGVGHMIFVRK